MQNLIESELDRISINFLQLKSLSTVILEAAESCVESLMRGNKIMFCGNGGSAADSQHLAAELVCKYKKERPALNAIALTPNSSIITATANDIAFDCIFERQVEALGKEGDVLIAISTSGMSKNVLRAVERAKKLGIKTIAFTGQKGGLISDNADIKINVPSNITNNVQEMILAVGHIICEIIEKEIFE